jgi:hypothetical protein
MFIFGWSGGEGNLPSSAYRFDRLHDPGACLEFGGAHPRSRRMATGHDLILCSEFRCLRLGAASYHRRDMVSTRYRGAHQKRRLGPPSFNMPATGYLDGACAARLFAPGSWRVFPYRGFLRQPDIVRVHVVQAQRRRSLYVDLGLVFQLLDAYVFGTSRFLDVGIPHPGRTASVEVSRLLSRRL